MHSFNLGPKVALLDVGYMVDPKSARRRHRGLVVSEPLDKDEVVGPVAQVEDDEDDRKHVQGHHVYSLL